MRSINLLVDDIHFLPFSGSYRALGFHIDGPMPLKWVHYIENADDNLAIWKLFNVGTLDDSPAELQICFDSWFQLDETAFDFRQSIRGTRPQDWFERPINMILNDLEMWYGCYSQMKP